MRADAVLLDIDGVLVVSWEAIPGAVDAIAWLRGHGVPFRLITNTTTQSRGGLAATLGEAGFDVRPEEIVTAVTATASHLATAHPGATVFVLTDGDPAEDLDARVVERPEDADVVVIGGASERFTYPVIDAIFRRLMDGAPLVGMHRNLYWRAAEGWQLDGGAYIAGLEEATGRQATICGKPSSVFFQAALRELGVPAVRAAMVGDDVVTDVMGAKDAGCAGVLVRTGKFQEPDLAKGSPDAVLGSVAELPGWLEG